ncbi:hypothetical protein AR685_03240 [Chryseobacterium sp. JAH]|nr:hypothetical protein AR685_03240 [Chryseobacterium sp. JAH]
MMNQERTNAVKSIIFYIVLLLIIVAINVSGKFKSGPCSPSLDILSVFGGIIINITLLIINGIKAFVMKREARLSTFVHFAVLIIWVILIFGKIV